MALLRELRHLCEQDGIKISALHLPGVQNLWDDRQSRIRDSTDWLLLSEALAYIQLITGIFVGQVLARRNTAVLPAFWEDMPDPSSRGPVRWGCRWSPGLLCVPLRTK